MANELRYDGKVAIVTGAGNGLGREHALLLGARGARVVVNDLGGGVHGDGKSSAAADKVVAEIKAAGGVAVANYDSVENGASIVQAALDAFGTVDIVINNAGILRDSSFHKMTPEDWDLVYRVHLKGAFAVTHAAWPILRDKGYGRVIMTSSAAGIYGNFGQANYSAAKLGLVGFASTLAAEGRAKNIHVNAIAPVAGSRMTETVMPPDLVKALKPAFVSPLVAWLCHENCQETGGLFEVGAGYMSKLRWERTRGTAFPMTRALTPDAVASRWAKIVDFTDAEHPTNTQQALAPVLDLLSNPSLGGNEFLDLDVASKAEAVMESSYTERDLALYALGVGAAADPLDARELAFVYEGNGKGFYALPTYGAMPAMNAMLEMGRQGRNALPGLSFGLERALHGEQYTEIKRPLPPNAKLKNTFRLKAAYDKAPHALVVLAVTTTDESGEELAYNEITTFVRGAGGWGGERGPAVDANEPPAREPDAVIEERTERHQALLYRLSGDWNPLHADPAFARNFGFDQPILQGLCTYGYVARHVIKACCDNDPRRFKSIKVRFADSVIPGETLVTRIWKESDTRIVFETRVKERDKMVIKNAAIELYREIPQAKARPAAQAVAGPVAPAAAAAAVSAEPTAADVFTAIGQYLTANPGLGAQIKTVFQFKIGEQLWLLNLADGNGSVGPGVSEKPDVTLELSEADFVAMSTGKADANKLYFAGRMKASGNVLAAQKLMFLQKIEPARIHAAASARSAGGSSDVMSSATQTAAQAVVAAKVAAPARIAKAGAIFAKLGERLTANPKTAGGFAGHVVRFELSDPGDSWLLDLSGKTPKVVQGASGKSAAVFSLTDEDLEGLASGAAEPRDLYQRGRLKVQGDLRLARELCVLKSLGRL